MKDAFCLLLVVALTASLAVFPSSTPAEVEVTEPTQTQPVEIVVETEPPQIDFVEEIEVTEPTEPEVTEPVDTEPVATYTDEELDLLARIIHAEAGSSWIPDEIQLYVGSVVLNRVDSNRFPDTIRGVIYQSGQYSPTWTGAINKTPSQRAIDNAKYLLENGSVLPNNVVFQAGFRQGSGVHYKYYDSTLGTTTYFCYI